MVMRAEFQRPEGVLLEKTRTERRPIMSVTEASARAGLSTVTWRAYTNGYRILTAGNPIQMIAPAATLARMAAAVGLQPRDLEGARRPDAAFVLAGGSTDELDPELIPKFSDAHVPKTFVPEPALELIESLRLAIFPSLSLRKAAAAARISYTQWRNLTAGMPRAGHRVQVHASAAVVARMADAVNASPDQIAAKGRPDAAAIMVTAESDRDAANALQARWRRLATDLQVVSADELKQISSDVHVAAGLLDVVGEYNRGVPALLPRLLDGASALHRLADLLEAIEEREEREKGSQVSAGPVGTDALTA